MITYLCIFTHTCISIVYHVNREIVVIWTICGGSEHMDEVDLLMRMSAGYEHMMRIADDVDMA